MFWRGKTKRGIMTQKEIEIEKGKTRGEKNLMKGSNFLDSSQSLRLYAYKEHIAVMEWDQVGEKVNKLDRSTLQRLQELLAELKTSSYKCLVLISRKKNIFIAGADIQEIQNLREKQECFLLVRQGQEILSSLEKLPIPIIAAIHGACLGGGCELVLSCDYRIASDSSATRIGLPEVKLGVIPGFGGCVRLPRKVGLVKSLDVILAGKALSAKESLRCGLVDKVVHSSILEEQALKWAEQIIQSPAKNKKASQKYRPPSPMHRLMDSFLLRPLILSQARKKLYKLTHGHYPAPLKALEVVGRTYGRRNLKKSLEVEAKAFSEVGVTEISKNLIHLFYLMEGIKKQNGLEGLGNLKDPKGFKDSRTLGGKTEKPSTDLSQSSFSTGKKVGQAGQAGQDKQVGQAPQVTPLTFKNIAILGAGVMGAGIAYVGADKGIRTLLKDISYPALCRGLQNIYGIWQKRLSRRRLTALQFKQKKNLLSASTSYDGFKQMDLVVEAAVEDMELKKKILQEISHHTHSRSVVVTNTSSLSVNALTPFYAHPEKFAGLHFFNPVEKMPLVEVIYGDKTSPETIASLFAFVKKMGKTPVVVKDSPGFLVNRILLPYMLEAIHFLQEGICIEKLDKAFVGEFGLPMGPFRLMDKVGLDVAVKVLKIFSEAFADRMEIPPVVGKLAQSSRLGEKGKKGFYLYRNSKVKVDSSIYAELGLKNPRKSFSTKPYMERALFTMVNEASLVLHKEKLVKDAATLDLAMIMGTGFPPFRGGLLKYADHLGIKYIVDQLNTYAKAHGKRLRAFSPLQEMADQGKSFYS